MKELISKWSEKYCPQKLAYKDTSAHAWKDPKVLLLSELCIWQERGCRNDQDQLLQQPVSPGTCESHGNNAVCLGFFLSFPICKSLSLFLLFPFPWWERWGLTGSICHSVYCCPALNGGTATWNKTHTVMRALVTPYVAARHNVTAVTKQAKVKQKQQQKHFNG